MQAIFDDSEAINGFIIAEEYQYLRNVEYIQAENDEQHKNIFKVYFMIEDIQINYGQYQWIRCTGIMLQI